MGLLDTILGRTKPVRANLDALFALPSAAVTLEASAGLLPSGHAGVCWKPPAGRSPEDVQAEIGQLLQLSDDPMDGLTTAGSGAPGPPASVPAPASASPIGQLEQKVDSYGYRWLLLADPEMDDLVSRVHLVNSTLADNGWGPQLLVSVFGLIPAPDAGPETSALYLVYLFKRGTFYPFAPNGDERRDNELELRVRGFLGSDLPIEEDLSRWFPLWDLPVP